MRISDSGPQNGENINFCRSGPPSVWDLVTASPGHAPSVIRCPRPQAQPPRASQASISSGPPQARRVPAGVSCSRTGLSPSSSDCCSPPPGHDSFGHWPLVPREPMGLQGLDPRARPGGLGSLALAPPAPATLLLGVPRPPPTSSLLPLSPGHNEQLPGASLPSPSPRLAGAGLPATSPAASHGGQAGELLALVQPACLGSRGPGQVGHEQPRVAPGPAHSQGKEGK